MKYLISILIIFNFLCLSGQDIGKGFTKNNTLRLYSGIGFTAVRFEYYDKDKYTGRLLPFGFEWERQTTKSSWRVYGKRSLGNIKTDYDDAEIRNQSLGFDIYFPIHHFTLFKSKASLLLGPSTFLDEHFRHQNKVALDGSLSSIGAWSLGPGILINIALLEKLHYSTLLRFNLLTYVSQGEMENGFLSINNAFISSSSLSLHWQVLESLDLGINYRSDYMNIKKWDAYVSGTDFLLLSINLKL